MPAGGTEAAALKLALTGLCGAALEWYDFFLYATAAALVFPTLFFPATLPPFVALIASFSTFAVGFLARPFGAVVFGHLGDRVGRKTTLSLAMIVMGSATTLIGLLPPYQSAGILSPLALVLLRLVQGVAVGGQWGGAILLATESAPLLSRGLYGSIAQAGAPVGLVLANSAFLAANGASPGTFIAYGWRIPFVLSIAVVGLGILVYFRVEETKTFRQLTQNNRLSHPPPADGAPLETPGTPSRATATAQRGLSPVLDALRLYPRLILVAAGAYVSTNLTFYILITYVVAYGASVAGLQVSRSTMLTATLIANLAMLPVLFLAGGLSDRFGRRRTFMTGVALMGAWSFILFPLLETRSLWWILVAALLGQCINALTYGPLAAMFAELFSTRVRYSAASLAYQIAAILGGGVAPIVATALFARYQSNLWVSAYMAGVCALSLVCASMLEETRGTDLDTRVESTL